MARTCNRCGSDGPFYDSQRYGHCKVCVRAASSRWREENPEYGRRWRQANPRRMKSYIVAEYGMTVEEYDALAANQGGCCAICAERPERDLVVDHDHATGAVRGLLCHPCNHGLGHLRDDPVRLRGALAYLAAPPAQGHLTLRAA